MEQLYKQIECRGHYINIYYDENAESPREWSNLGTFYTSHRNYLPEKDFYKNFEHEEVFDERGGFQDSFLKHYVALKIYLYDHSGLTISSSPFSCPWDSGLFGMVAVDVEKVKKEYGWKALTSRRRRKIEEYLQGEINTYDQYLRGEVYGFQVTPIDDGGEIIDSCWGYFGKDGLEQIESECRAIIDNLIARKQQDKQTEQLRLFGPEFPFPEFA